MKKITATKEEKIWTIGTVLFILLSLIIGVFNFDTQLVSASDSQSNNNIGINTPKSDPWLAIKENMNLTDEQFIEMKKLYDKNNYWSSTSDLSINKK